MSTDRLTDSLDRRWSPGATLGRGSWGRCRLIRDDAGREAVLKEPLTDADFPADAPLPDDLVGLCRRAADETATAQRDTDGFLPRLEATVDLGGGRTGLVLPRYTTLERRVAAGLPLPEALRVVARVAGLLADHGVVHGALRPSNVLFGERGELFLADPFPQALAPHALRLLEAAGARDWAPPEARAGARPTAAWDTWALCRILHAAILAAPGSPAPAAEVPLDKLAVAALKDKALARLATEGSNPRFRARVAERLGTLLSRGLSADAEPSPPFRFATARELAERVSEVTALVRPKVVDVGRLLLPGTATDGVFQGGSEASFSVTVGCTPGVSDPDDLVCGLQLVDLDAADPVPPPSAGGDPPPSGGGGRRPVEDARVSIQVHPSGRLRFQLGLPGLPPGRYRLRVAFAVKDSGDEPVVQTGEFQVRPPPGYVPPPPELPARAAIPFPKVLPEHVEEPLTDPGAPSASSEPTDPHAGVVVGFPRPVAPPEDDEPEPVPPPPPRPLADAGPRPMLDEPDNTPVPGQLIPIVVPSPRPSPPPLRALPDPPEEPDALLDTEELLADTDDLDALGTPSRPAPPPDADLAPSGTDDLPGFAPAAASRLPGPVAAALELLRRDPYLSAGAAVAASLALVLVATLLLKAC